MQGLAYTVDIQGGAIEVSHADGMGSVRALTDGSGSVVQTHGTDVFGVLNAALTWGSRAQPFGYTGEQQDGTGLVYLRARMYDPTSGRFLQRDRVAGMGLAPTSLHRSAYAGNNPINFTDPSGNIAFVAVPAVVWAAGAVTVGFTAWWVASGSADRLAERLQGIADSAANAGKFLDPQGREITQTPPESYRTSTGTPGQPPQDPWDPNKPKWPRNGSWGMKATFIAAALARIASNWAKATGGGSTVYLPEVGDLAPDVPPPPPGKK